MPNRIARWGGWFFLFAMGLLALVAASTLLWAVWPEKWRGEGAAAWVQAIGSILAILVAIWVPARQSQKAMEARRLDQLQANIALARRLNILAYDFTFIMLDMGVKVRGTWIFELNVLAVTDMLDRLRDLERAEADDFRAGLAFDLRRLVRDLRACFRVRDGIVQPFEDTTGKLRDLLDSGDALIFHTKAAVAAAEAALHGKH